MIKAYTTIHAVSVKVSNFVARALVGHIDTKIAKSVQRASKAQELRARIRFTTDLVLEREETLRRDLAKQLKSAARLINA